MYLHVPTHEHCSCTRDGACTSATLLPNNMLVVSLFEQVASARLAKEKGYLPNNKIQFMCHTHWGVGDLEAALLSDDHVATVISKFILKLSSGRKTGDRGIFPGRQLPNLMQTAPGQSS
jgi:hypothetical protein